MRVGVWDKTDGGWMVKLNHANNDQPTPGEVVAVSRFAKERIYRVLVRETWLSSHENVSLWETRTPTVEEVTNATRN